MRKIYKIEDWIGKKVNRLTITGETVIINGKEKVIATCDCGIIRAYILQNIITENTKSCGCWNYDRIASKNGCSRHPLYDVWTGMIARCYNTDTINYYLYGGNGVEVCDEWRNSVEIFYKWAIDNGWKQGLHLDKDKLSPNNKEGKLYCPEYCCFLTKKENARYKRNNRVIEYNGVSMCMAAWVEKFNIKYHTFKQRLNRGWSMDKIINTPSDEYHNRKKIA